MGSYNQTLLTTKGKELLTASQTGSYTVVPTKAATGNGSYSSSEDASSRTELKSKKQEFPLAAARVQNKTNVYVRFVATNNPEDGTALDAGYYIKEFGIYAKPLYTNGTSGSEVLYAICTAVTDQWDYMPSYNGLAESTEDFEAIVEVTNAESAVLNMPNRKYLYDDVTGEKYLLGVENGVLYFESEE